MAIDMEKAGLPRPSEEGTLRFDDDSSSISSSEGNEKEKEIEAGRAKETGLRVPAPQAPRQVSFKETQQPPSPTDTHMAVDQPNNTGHVTTTESLTSSSSSVLAPVRPPFAQRATTQASNLTTATATQTKSLPQLKRKETRMMQKHAHPWEHIGITLGGPMIILFDIVVPCIIYYTWYYKHRSQWVDSCVSQYNANPDSLRATCPLPKPEFDKDILGYSVISFGFGELWILLARVWRLYFRWEDCAPLCSRAKWELDATSWVYGVAMIVALIPFVVGSSLVIPRLYLYGPSFLMGFLGVLMLITTFVPFKLPIGINSQPRGGRLRPFIYYAAEDFIAVDGLQDREFRVRYNERYETNKRFARMFVFLTWWWLLGVCVYIGCASAIIFTLDFHFAFGTVFGVLFAYIGLWALATATYVKWEVAREHRMFEEGKFDG